MCTCTAPAEAHVSQSCSSCCCGARGGAAGAYHVNLRHVPSNHTTLRSKHFGSSLEKGIHAGNPHCAECHVPVHHTVCGNLSTRDKVVRWLACCLCSLKP